MKKLITLLTLIVFIASCKNDSTKKEQVIDNKVEAVKTFDDSDYALNPDYKVGDVRRYGIFPDSAYAANHPFSKKSKIETILDLAQNEEIEMSFPKGYYKTSIFIKGRENITLKFDDAEFGGVIQIIENDSTPSQNITFKGSLSSYVGFLSRKSNDISINDLTIKSNKDKNIYGLLSQGCHIYAGTKNISINELIIEGLGSGGDKYKNYHAALAVDGWNNNPENVQIKKVHIKSSDRHGIYLTGKDHLIGDVIIDKFGDGSSKDMSGMQDANNEIGENKEFKALWVNKCYDSFIEKITINEKDSKGKYTAHFDYGDKNRPVTIGTFKVENDSPKINILEEDTNGVIIEIKE